MITSSIKKQTFVCCSISLNPYMVFQTWNQIKKVKRKAILLLAYCADVSCITNRSFYMRTLSLIDIKNPFFIRKIKKLNKKLLELKTCNFWLKIRNF